MTHAGRVPITNQNKMHTKKYKLAVSALAVTSALAAASVHAQTADALLDKLVDKGVLTLDEANELREDSKKNFNAGYKVKTGLPDWVTSLRIGGDFRGRYEMFNSDEPTFVDRHRFRYRIRPGIVATLRDNFEIGFRLTSGESQGNFGGDPISGNTTFQDNASKKFVYIDQAYGRWQAINGPAFSGAFTVGKMENPFVFSDMVFDGDYTPEGLAQQFSYAVNKAHKVRFNLGQFALDEVGASSRDPFLFGAQLRLDSVWSEQIATSIGISGLAITSDENLRETPAGAGFTVVDAGGVPRTIPGAAASSNVPNIQRGNTRDAAGQLVNNYNPWVADAAITYTLESFPAYAAKFPIRFGAEYMNNPGADDRNEGYAFGITFGKSGKRGLWDVSYRWKHLEGDAWYEEMTDSDFGGLRPAVGAGRASYASGTNVEGHVFKANYSPFDSLTVGITYFLAEIIAGTPAGFDEDVGRLQLDAVWKF